MIVYIKGKLNRPFIVIITSPGFIEKTDLAYCRQHNREKSRILQFYIFLLHFCFCCCYSMLTSATQNVMSSKRCQTTLHPSQLWPIYFYYLVCAHTVVGPPWYRNGDNFDFLSIDIWHFKRPEKSCFDFYADHWCLEGKTRNLVTGLLMTKKLQFVLELETLNCPK